MDRSYYKKKITKYINKMNGGVCSTCPKYGFQQHLGECWHDAFSMILLYSDNISEQIQHVFDDNFDFDKCAEYAKINSPDYLLPLNIEPENYEEYVKLCKDYFNNMYLRYNNEKLKIFTKPKRDHRLRPSSMKGGILTRKDSINLTLACTYNSYKLYNINNVSKKNFKMREHGGNNTFDNINLCNFNYFILNYQNDQKYILSQQAYNLYILFKNGDNFTIASLRKLQYDLKNAIGISIGLINSITDKNMLQTTSAHAQCFFTCKSTHFFYDDNGINSSKDLYPDEYYKFANIDTEKIEQDTTEDSLKDYGDIIVKNIKKTFVEFNWKTYLSDKIDEIIDIIEKKSSNNELLFLKISDFYYGHSDKNTVGRKYLKYYNIISLNLIFKKELKSTNEVLYTNDIDIMNYTIYTNNRVYNTICKKIEMQQGNIIYFIMLLVMTKNIKFMIQLISKYVPDSNKQIVGNAVLNSLIMGNYIDIVSFFLDNYKNIQISISNLKYAIDEKNNKLLEIFIKSDKLNQDDIYIVVDKAITTHNVKTLEILMPLIDINKEDTYEYNYLYVAIKNNNVDAVKLLLERKDLNINKLNKYGNSNLDIAIEDNKIDIIQLLLTRSDLIISEKNKKWLESNNL